MLLWSELGVQTYWGCCMSGNMRLKWNIGFSVNMLLFYWQKWQHENFRNIFSSFRKNTLFAVSLCCCVYLDWICLFCSDLTRHQIQTYWDKKLTTSLSAVFRSNLVIRCQKTDWRCWKWDISWCHVTSGWALIIMSVCSWCLIKAGCFLLHLRAVRSSQRDPPLPLVLFLPPPPPVCLLSDMMEPDETWSSETKTNIHLRFSLSKFMK